MSISKLTDLCPLKCTFVDLHKDKPTILLSVKLLAVSKKRSWASHDIETWPVAPELSLSVTCHAHLGALLLGQHSLLCTRTVAMLCCGRHVAAEGVSQLGL